MTEEEKEMLWAWLRRIERKINLVGSFVILGGAWAFAKFSYREIPNGWGLSKDAAWWASIAIGIGIAIYFGRQFDKD